jgi:flavin-dependent dehydrogenase
VVLDRQPRLWDECGHYPLVGDAGTVIPPLCGDGMSIALYTGRECAVAADSYLRGEIDLREWRIQYEQSVLRALRGPLQWGLIAHRWATHPLLIRWTGRIASLWPGISTKIVRLTRLNM